MTVEEWINMADDYGTPKMVRIVRLIRFCRICGKHSVANIIPMGQYEGDIKKEPPNDNLLSDEIRGWSIDSTGPSAFLVLYV